MYKKKWKKYLVVLLLLAVVVGSGVKVYTDSFSGMQKMQEVLYLIDNYYVEEINVNNLITAAIRGIFEELDPFSGYLSADAYDEMQLEFDGHFEGIGIVITTRDDKLTIVSPIKGTPGDKAGLEAGDVITHVDDNPTSEMSQKKAVDLMRGEEGTEVELTISREGEEEPLLFEITRANIEIPFVQSEVKEDDIGYVILTQFAEDVGTKVEQAFKDLEEKGARGFIFDLRNNPGGILKEAVNVSSNFIDEGVIVTEKRRTGEDRVWTASKRIDSTDLPVVILINRGSASASEIVSAAVKDYNRGKLVGTTTFGKGTVQSVVPLSDGSALRITTARYYTPSETSIHETGIEPDYEVKFDPETDEDEQLNKAVEVLKKMISSEKNELKKAAGQ